MRKIFSVFFVLVMLLSLCACGADSQTNDTTATENCIHAWTAATCDTPKTCSVCGAKEGYALGHSWDEDTCTVCDTVDPDYNYLINGTWLYITKQKWQVIEFYEDGTCDIRNIYGMPAAYLTLEEGVNAFVANLQSQYKDKWEQVAASRYQVMKIDDYYYIADMTGTAAEYTTEGKNIVIAQAGLLATYIEMINKNKLINTTDDMSYVNMEVHFLSDLLSQYKRINET